jgi:uncharacterized protein (UPF0332 family)
VVVSVAPFLQKAEQALRDAKALLALGSTDATCDRCYYAAFSAVQAALLSQSGPDELAPKTHQGLHLRFSQLFIKTGHLPAVLSTHLKRLEHHRLEADYAAFSQSPEAAASALALAQEFVHAVRAFLERQPDHPESP